jgi:hypothetical protein
LGGCITADVEHHAEGEGAQSASPHLDLTTLVAMISAIGALGTAAFSLVDATKALGGGVSRIGLSDLERAAGRYTAALEHALGKDERNAPQWKYAVAAHWMNGRPRDEQKAMLKGLVRLGLSAESAAAIAGPAHVDPARLQLAAQKLEQGAELEPADIQVLGRLDASVEAQLDAAFDRADQKYRNWSRVAAAFAAVGLALVAAWAFDQLERWPIALFVGLLAVPFAPIAKDLASSLQAAASALRFGKP